MEKKVVEKTCQTILHDTSCYLLNFLIFPHRVVANAYVGCMHDCVYCYAKWYSRKGQITAKINAHEILRKELEKRIRKNKPKEPVCLGSVSDPYQPIEKKYKITRKMLEVCDALSYPVFIVTKSDLVARDKDILKSLAERNLVAVNFTITPLNNEVLAKVEPYATNNEKRLKAMNTLTKAGVPCSIYLSPIFPFLSNSRLIYNIIKRASEDGAHCCSAIFLKIRPIVWKYFKDFLKNHYNFLISEYEKLYFKHGDKDLSNYKLPEYTYRRKMMEKIAEKCKEYNLKFTSEEFFDLWTTPYSDCADINCWHAPTAYDIYYLMKSQSSQKISLDEVVRFIRKNFHVDDKYIEKFNRCWKDRTFMK